MTFVFLPAIEGGTGGCLHCGAQHAVLPMDALIAVGFGDASVTRNGELVYSEPRADDDGFATFWEASDAEKAAAADPDHDWRVHLVAPLSERHYQRQGPEHWVLYEKGEGFA